MSRKRSTTNSTVHLSLVLFWLLACQPEDPESLGPHSPGSGFFQEDSAGISISVSAGTLVERRVDWDLDSLPDLVLGAEAEPAQEFFGIGGVRGLPGGQVLVVDGISRELRFFDSEGHLVRRVGRKGEGPGEFDEPVLIPTAGTDSLLFWDTRLQRFQRFSLDGMSHHTISLARRSPTGAAPPAGAIGSTVLVRELEDEANVPASQQTGGAKREWWNYEWFSPTTGEVTPLETFTILRIFITLSRQHAPGASGIPFSPRPAAAVWESGAVLTDGVSPEIREYDLEGSLQRIFRVAEPRRPVTHEMLDAMVRLKATTTRASRAHYEDVYSRMPIPDSLPVFDALLVDEIGWLWAKRYEWEPTKSLEWVIFDPSGRAHGALLTPAGFDVQWIGADQVLGVSVDDLGVEYVSRYRLRRGLLSEGGH